MRTIAARGGAELAFWLIILVAMLIHSSFKGSKVLISLFAIDLGASAATIGLLFAMYAVFPVILSFYAGKASDRVGYRLPVLFGASGLLAALLLPYFFPSLPTLFLSAALAGACYIFYVVSIQHLIGAYAEGPDRTRNYGIFSICIGLTSLLGPTVTGFSIDGVGHRATYLLLAAFPAIPILALLAIPALLPPPLRHGRRDARHRVTDLLGNPPLRRVLIATALLETGMELFNFLMPIYGHSIGLTASQIGIVMGAFALALMMARSAMPALVRRSSEERVFSVSMFVAGAACVGFPLVSSIAPLLAMAFVLGLGMGSGAPLSMTLAYNRSPAGRSGEAIGLRQSVNKGMEAVVPVIFGLLSTAFSFTPVYWLGALLLAGGGWLMHGDARHSSKGKPT
jgi:MFS family permease